MLKDSKPLMDRLKMEEGFRQYPYLDSLGILTIGYGHNLVSNGVSREEAEIMLFSDVLKASRQVDAALPWSRDMDEVRYAILIDMAFNMGIKSLLKFKKTLSLVKAKLFQEAAIEMLQSVWAKQVGDRADRLAKAMDDGKWWES
jgi:lysozyme